jgi:hypothetical protein
MTDKQKYIIDVIEANSEYRFENSGLSAYDFIGEHMEVYRNYKIRQSTRIGIVRLTGLLFDFDSEMDMFIGGNPMDFRN